MFLFCIVELGMVMLLHLLFLVCLIYYTRTSWFRFNKVLFLIFLYDQYSSKAVYSQIANICLFILRFSLRWMKKLAKHT